MYVHSCRQRRFTGWPLLVCSSERKSFLPSITAPAKPTMNPVKTVPAGVDAGTAAGARARTVSRRRSGARRPARHRYWSIRDLSRRMWQGRGYELLRAVIHTGILPATRSARSWWVSDEDVLGLQEAFEARGGRVRAFRGLDRWLRDRCYALPLTPQVEELLGARGEAGLAWRGTAYLPKTRWRAETSAGGDVVYRHRSGAMASPTHQPAA